MGVGRGRLGLAILVAWLALAGDAGALVIQKPQGHRLGVLPRAGVTPGKIAGAPRGHAARAAQPPCNPPPPGGTLPYCGGPVLHASAPYLILWDPNNEISPSSRSLLARFLSDVVADSGRSSNVYGVARQYTDDSGFADYRQTFNPATQVIVDTNQYPQPDLVNCPDVSPSYPTCVTDDQLQAELKSVVGATLPVGLSGAAPIYLLVTPPSVNICAPPGVPVPCADNAFCAYHSSSIVPARGIALYAAIPMLPLGQSDHGKACQADGNAAVQEPNGDPADVVLKYLSHEDNEAITDPLFNAWVNQSTGQENGDQCNFTGATDPANGANPNAFTPTLGGSASAGSLFNQLINGHPYYIQSEWSNGDSACDMQPAPGAVNASFTAPGSVPVGSGVPFDPSTSSSSQGFTSVTWDFGDGSAPQFAAGAGAPGAVAHTYRAAGSFRVSLTLVDTLGNVSTAARTVVVGSPPVARFSLSPSRQIQGATVRFNSSSSTDPDAGVGITSYRWSFGDGSTATGVNPSHAYRRPGTYTVTLIATNRLSLSSGTTRRVTIVAAVGSSRVGRSGNGVIFVVRLNTAGYLTLNGTRFHVHRPEWVRLKVKLSSRQLRGLARSHRISVSLAFVPFSGSVFRQSLALRG